MVTSNEGLQVYGKDSVFDADRLIDLLAAFEDFSVASKSAQGDMDVGPPRPGTTFTLPNALQKSSITSSMHHTRSTSNGQASISRGQSQSGATSVSHNGQASSKYRSYGSNDTSGNGNGREVGSYSGVGKSRGNDYQARMSNGNTRSAGSSGNNNGAAPYAGKVSNNGNTFDAGSLRGNSKNNGSAYGYGSNVDSQMYNGQGSSGRASSNGQHLNGQGQLVSSGRQNSGQDAGSSSAGLWGSWSDWSRQVLQYIQNSSPCCCKDCAEMSCWISFVSRSIVSWPEMLQTVSSLTVIHLVCVKVLAELLLT